MKSLILILNFTIFYFHQLLLAQCNPAPAFDCVSSNVFCSLDELNGFSCQNSKTPNPTGCFPLCPNGGSSSNAYWWAFVTEGGNVNISVTVSNCVNNNNGIRMGLWGDCNCSETVDCLSKCTNNGTFQISGVLEPCKIYYFFVDGCVGDLCDFTLTTSGGQAPKLKPLEKINNDPDGKIFVCESPCPKRFSVNSQPGGCTPEYVWTLDGVVQKDQNRDYIDLVFPGEGDFTLCVTAIIGNPISGSICSQEGPQCAQIKVRKEMDRVAGPRFICADQLPFSWHGELVDRSGEYRQTFMDTTNCCIFDSVVFFVPLPEIQPPHVYFIDCEHNYYIDPSSKDTIRGCNNDLEVFVKKSTIPYRCDSSYLLSTAFPTIKVLWNASCDQDSVEFYPSIQVQGECSSSYSEKMEWHRKDDTTNTIISTSDRIKIPVTDLEEYCLRYTTEFTLGSANEICVKEICPGFKASDLVPEIQIVGDDSTHVGDTILYSQKNIPDEIKHLFQYFWTVEGGHIITADPQYNNEIQVVWDAKNTNGKICLHIISTCDTTDEICLNVSIQSGTSSTDETSDQIQIIPNPNNGSFSIMGVNDGTYNAEWFDLNGKKIGEKENIYIYKNPVVFTKKQLARGIYYLHIYNDKLNILKKVIIEY